MSTITAMHDPYESIDLKPLIVRALRTARERTGLSQDRLAARAGISTRYYQSIEAGENLPSIEILFKLAAAFQCSYTDILDPIWLYWQEQRKN